MGLITEQYKDSSNFVARIELNRKFSTNPQPLTRWLFDQMDFQKSSRVLELGCGNAILWRTNKDKIVSDEKIVLTDFSEGMLDDAKKVLGSLRDRFEFKVMDAENISFPENSFDIVIANLMLYHVPNRKEAFNQITKVLADNGLFYASTFGRNNMKELNELVQEFYPQLNSLETLSNRFGLENGKSQLEDYFEKVTMTEYHDHLEITDAQPVIEYFLSFAGNKSVLKPDKLDAMKTCINEVIEDNGFMKVTKETGLFRARYPFK
ncbi:Methyltransferase type 11 [Methanobacterium lacus]|uniref:Methyltransferase type 11 n=1 Tax=Methanobacterium lacus (strain AL-21) TaxID=877455 RepID=F0TB56_METLA|nr:class I SAM-dependent methyltransferase [Methanobacterium lacus]ADZ10202.1 Methyltransferase type 11 [Methanobacterium lacus]